MSLIIQVGTQVQGGDTVYYGGVSGTPFKAATKANPQQGLETCGKEIHRRPHSHGQYQVASFEKIPHEGTHWKGKRGIISFYLNRQLLGHFQKYGRTHFDANRELCLG